MQTQIRKKIMLWLVVLAIMVGTLVFPAAALADDEERPAVEIQVAPTAIIVTMEGGEVLEGDSKYCTTGHETGCKIHVKNTGRETFEFRVYVTPYSITSENNQAAFSTDNATSYTQISRWLTLESSSGSYAKEVRYTINPEETIDISFRVEVPDDVPGGMQRAAIWAEAINNSSNSSGNMGISTNARAGVVVAGHTIGATNQSSEIYDYGFDRFSFGGTLSAHATVKNTGNTDFIIYSTYTAETFMGKVLKEASESVPAYPDVEYHLSTEWDNTPYLGIFSINYKVSAGGTEHNETHIAIIMPIPIVILVISLLTIVIIWIIIIIRKRKERKARMLV